MVGGGGEGLRCVIQKGNVSDKALYSNLKKDLLFRHIELSKGVKQCQKSCLQMF